MIFELEMMIKFVFEKSLPSFQLVGYDENEQDEEKEEKNGAHKHLSSSLTSLASKYSGHVVLCKNKANILKTTLTVVILGTSLIIRCFE